MEEPAVKRAVAFVDGQNLFRHAKEAFGHHHPNHDPNKLFDAVCGEYGWQNRGVRYYTGVPKADKDPFWHGYWTKRLRAMRNSGIHVTYRTLKYPGGRPVEKGIDVRIALDVIRMARQMHYDVGVIFSQDQDLAEVAREVRSIARSQERWIKLVSAFPSSPTTTSRRGVDRTDWLPIERHVYDACLDPRDYRPRTVRQSGSASRGR